MSSIGSNNNLVDAPSYSILPRNITDLQQELDLPVRHRGERARLSIFIRINANGDFFYFNNNNFINNRQANQ